jgi:hypothetical protein
VTNLFYISLAYKMAILQLALPEVNFVSKQLNLPTPHPIQMADMREAMVSPPQMKNLGVLVETTNFVFNFANGKLHLIVNKEKNIESVDLYPKWANTPSLISSNGAYQLATQWLTAIEVDVGALKRKYGSQLNVEQAFFWNQPGIEVHHPPGDTNKTMLPIFNVTWGDGTKTEYPVQIRILGTTKELMGLTLGDPSLSRRPPLFITNALELNNTPDPVVMHLQHPAAPTLETNPPASTNLVR